MNESLLNALVETINTTVNGKKKAPDTAYILNDASKEIVAANVKNWISTGSTLLDLAISNRKDGGIASGRICELQGMEATGKSLIGAHILASTQKLGGIAIYIDTESAISTDFLKVIGVDLDKLIYAQLNLVEDIYETIENLINRIKESGHNKLVTILVDSMSQATTKVEMESDFNKDGWSTTKSIINSKAMRKITNLVARENVALIMTNQLRSKLGAMWGDDKTTSGGFAIGFAASTRVRFTKAQKLKDSEGDVIGLYIKARIMKSRFGPSERTVEFPLYFSSGIDNEGSLLLYLKGKGLVKSGGAWYTLSVVDKDTGEITDIKFQAKTWIDKLNEIPGLRDYVYDLVCETFIMKYIYDNRIDIDTLSIEVDKEKDDEFTPLNGSREGDDDE